MITTNKKLNLYEIVLSLYNINCIPFNMEGGAVPSVTRMWPFVTEASLQNPKSLYRSGWSCCIGGYGSTLLLMQVRRQKYRELHQCRHINTSGMCAQQNCYSNQLFSEDHESSFKSMSPCIGTSRRSVGCGDNYIAFSDYYNYTLFHHSYCLPHCSTIVAELHKMKCGYLAWSIHHLHQQ